MEPAPVCYSCGASHGPDGADLSECDGCRGALYCSRECQRVDWAAHHREVCKDPHTRPLLQKVYQDSGSRVMVWNFPGMGRGLVATQDLHPGTIIFDEPDAIVMFRNDLLGISRLFDRVPLARHLYQGQDKDPGAKLGPRDLFALKDAQLQHHRNRSLLSETGIHRGVGFWDWFLLLENLKALPGHAAASFSEMEDLAPAYAWHYSAKALSPGSGAADLVEFLGVSPSHVNHSCAARNMEHLYYNFRPHVDDPYARSVGVHGVATKLIPRGSQLFHCFTGSFSAKPHDSVHEELLRYKGLECDAPGRAFRKKARDKTLKRLRAASSAEHPTAFEAIIAYGYGFKIFQ